MKTIVHMQTNSLFSPQEVRCGSYLFFQGTLLFFQGTFSIFQGTLPATIGRWSRGHRAVVAGNIWERNGNLGFGNDLLCACLEYILGKKGWGVRTQQKSNVPQAAWGDRNRQFLLFMEIELFWRENNMNYEYTYITINWFLLVRPYICRRHPSKSTTRLIPFLVLFDFHF